MKSLLLSILCTVSLGAFSQNEIVQRFKTDIDSVTIFLSGAEVHHTKNVKLSQGRNLIIFEGLSPKANAKSIRVITPEEVSLLAISSKINYLTKTEENPRIQQLKDSVEIVTIKIDALKDELDALKNEKEMLLKNQSIGGQNNGVPVNDLKTATEYFRNRITEINILTTEKKRKIDKYNDVLKRLNNELSELNAKYTFERTEIAILVSTDKMITGNIELKYVVSDAGWAPSYDIKATDVNKPIILNYRAKAYNNTDIDWKNVNVKLSTSDPTQDVSKPVLNPWYLNYTYSGNVNKGSQVYQNQQKKEYQSNEGYVQNRMNTNVNIDTKNTGGIEFTQIEVPELTAEFNIRTKYTLPSDAKPYIIDISQHELPANFQHYAVTKLDKDVFLLAKITGWEDLNLLEGIANIYYGGTYVGQSYITTRNVSDTLDISLGKDSKVMVTRTKLKQYSEKQFLGSKTIDVRVFELVVKNNRKSPVQIVLYDQVPISQVQEIEVKVLEYSHAEYNSNTGEVKWKLTLQPGQIEKLRLSFSIKYPKNRKQEIELERKRGFIYAPDFK